MTDKTPTHTRTLRSIVLIVLLLGVGGAVAATLIASRKLPPRREIVTLPPLVESMVLVSQDVVETFVGYGSVRAIHRADIAAEVSATIVERVDAIREGSTVAKGQTLFRLDKRQYQRAFERSEALAAAERASLEGLAVEAEGLAKLLKTTEREMAVARDERTRVARLFEDQLAAKKEFDFANLAYQQAQRVLQEYQLQMAKLGPRRTRISASIRGFDQDAALAKLDIERCEIKAPFAGHIESLFADVGDLVTPGTVLVRLIDSSKVEIPIRLPAGVYSRVSRGAKCSLTSDGTLEVPWIGTIARIAPASDEQTRTFAVYAVVDNAAQEHPLIPGMFVTARVEGPIHRDQILIPRRAYRDGRVLIAEGNVARSRKVDVKFYIEDNAAISGDVRDGDLLILTRLGQLADGSRIRTRGTVSRETHTGTAPEPTGESLP